MSRSIMVYHGTAGSGERPVQIDQRRGVAVSLGRMRTAGMSTTFHRSRSHTLRGDVVRLSRNAEVQLHATISNTSAASYQRSVVCCNARSAVVAQDRNTASTRPHGLTRRKNASEFLDKSEREAPAQA